VSEVLRALVNAAPLVFDRRVLGLVLLPFVGAMVLWVIAWIAFGESLSGVIASLLAHGLAFFGMDPRPGAFASGFGAVLAFVVLTLVAGALALAAIAVFAGPVFVRAVEARHFPTLERRRGGTMAGSLWNAAVALAIFVPLWLLTLPLLFFPLVGVPVSLALGAWLNQRLFRYDALAEHASAEELATVVRTARGRLMGLGLAVAPLALVPVANLVAPLYAGLAFTYLCLGELATLRGPKAPAR
jgi:CysZ protein